MVRRDRVTGEALKMFRKKRAMGAAELKLYEAKAGAHA